MNSTKRFGALVLEAREARGMSQDRVGRLIDSSKSYVSSIESGAVRPPSPRMTRRICRVLGLDYQEMLAIGWLEKRPRDLSIDVAMQTMQTLREAV